MKANDIRKVSSVNKDNIAQEMNKSICKYTCVTLKFNFECRATVYPKKYAHGFVVLCFVVVMQSFIMNSNEIFIHIHQGCFAGTGAIVRLPQCQWSKPDGYRKISQRITTTKHSKTKTVCIFLGIYCISDSLSRLSWSHHRNMQSLLNFIQLNNNANYAQGYFCILF